MNVTDKLNNLALFLEMSLPKVSIIVPVFNAEQYLTDCVNSVIAQSYSDWELLLVDDGSTDESYRLCQCFSEKDERIIAIHQNNQGVSAARNLGLVMSRGEYVCFLDSDDYWFRSEVLSTLVGLADGKNLDIIRGEHICVEDGALADMQYQQTDNDDIKCELLSSQEFFNRAIHHDFFVPLSLFRKKIIAVKFDIRRRYLEDMLFYSQILSNDLVCGYLPHFAFYAYRKRDGSITNSHEIRLLADSFSICYEFIALSERVLNQPIFKDFIYSSYYVYHETVRTLASDPYFNRREVLIEEFAVEKLRKTLIKKMPFSMGIFSIYYPVRLLTVILRFRILLVFFVKKLFNKFGYVKSK